MKVSRRIILIVGAILIMTMLFSCGQPKETATTPDVSSTPAPASTPNATEQAAKEEPLSYPICEPGAETLTFWLPRMLEEINVIEDFKNNPAVQRAYEATGVNVEFELVVQENAAELYSLLIASNDLPDIVGHHTSYFITFGMGKGPDSVIEDGYFIRLNELIDKYAPNYKSWLYEGGGLSKYGKDIMTDAGNIAGFYTIFADGALPGSGLGYRKDVLDELGKTAPATIAGWEEIFDELQAADRYEHPFCLAQYGYSVNNDIIVSAFDVSFSFYQVDGKVKYGPAQEGYREYLRLMNKWYEKGYFSPSDVTEPNGFNALVNDGSMCYEAGSAAFGTMFADIGLTSVKDFYLAGAPSPKLTENQTLHLGAAVDAIGSPCAISFSCEKPEIAARWLDFWYSEEGEMLTSYGVEGVTYDLVNGKPVFNDFAKVNPSGLTLDQVIQTYAFGTICGIEHTFERMSTNPETIKSGTIWLNSNDGAYMLPTHLTLTPDEGSVLSAIQVDLETYVKENTARFISGELSLDNDWDSYLAKFDGMRLAKAVEIKQGALDRYFAR